MASPSRNATSSFMPPGFRPFLRRRTAEAAAAGIVLAAVALAVALWGYVPGDPSLDTAIAGVPQNPLGRPGAVAADLMLQSLGRRRVADPGDAGGVGLAHRLAPRPDLARSARGGAARRPAAGRGRPRAARRAGGLAAARGARRGDRHGAVPRRRPRGAGAGAGGIRFADRRHSGGHRLRRRARLRPVRVARLGPRRLVVRPAGRDAGLARRQGGLAAGCLGRRGAAVGRRRTAAAGAALRPGGGGRRGARRRTRRPPRAPPVRGASRGSTCRARRPGRARSRPGAWRPSMPARRRASAPRPSARRSSTSRAAMCCRRSTCWTCRRPRARTGRARRRWRRTHASSRRCWRISACAARS